MIPSCSPDSPVSSPAPLRPERSPVEERALRAAVLAFRERESRRVFEPVVQVGTPGGRYADCVDRWGRHLDPGTRCEIVAALLARALDLTGSPVTWWTRSGDLGRDEVDRRWIGPTLLAYAPLGLVPQAYVVTRQGWRDLLTDESRTWVRLRR